MRFRIRSNLYFSIKLFGKFHITFRFNCKVNSGAAFVSMSLTVDPFDPIVFAWYMV